jgi:hypothetical protein
MLAIVRPIDRMLRALAVGGVLLAAATHGHALPDPDTPIDPAKRAPVSTANALRPAAKPSPASPFAHPRIVRANRIRPKPSPVQKKRTSVAVRETRLKKTVTPERRNTGEPLDPPHTAADRMPAAVPRLDPHRFRRIVRDYEEGRIPAESMLAALAQPSTDPAGFGEVNRFVDPRSTLEAQGIPVVPAGGSGGGTPEGAGAKPASDPPAAAK